MIILLPLALASTNSFGIKIESSDNISDDTTSCVGNVTSSYIVLSSTSISMAVITVWWVERLLIKPFSSSGINELLCINYKLESPQLFEFSYLMNSISVVIKKMIINYVSGAKTNVII